MVCAPQIAAFEREREIVVPDFRGYDSFDAMAEATRTGTSYQTILDPPPGHGPRHLAR